MLKRRLLCEIFRLIGLRNLVVLAFACALGPPTTAEQAPSLRPKGDLIRVEFEAAGSTTMIGQNARKQLIVTGVYASGQPHDLMHDVTYAVDVPAVLNVDAEGMVIPTTDGTTTITAKVTSGLSATLAVSTSRCAEKLLVNFENEIAPIFTKLGCNTGGCHGKADGKTVLSYRCWGFIRSKITNISCTKTAAVAYFLRIRTSVCCCRSRVTFFLTVADNACRLVVRIGTDCELGSRRDAVRSRDGSDTGAYRVCSSCPRDKF